ncbi:MAG TPA: hypothetical protein PKI14_01265 [Fervidobacterium sp.]|nr:hypothetical protein [Fervidobacterium sp.]
MKKVEIKNKLSNLITNIAQLEDSLVEAWIADNKTAFGKDQHEVEITPAVLDENMQVITPAVTETIPAEYEIIITDITAQVAQEVINAEALAYLASTDWMIIRESEGGTPCPPEIKALRQAARLRIVR